MTSHAGIDSGDREVGSPLLQMMVMHDARPGATPLSMDTLKFFTEHHPSVLSRIISTTDESVLQREQTEYCPTHDSCNWVSFLLALTHHYDWC